jgi:transposase
VWDGLPAHRSRSVARWVESQGYWPEVEALPAYSPELNPIEYV